MEKRKLLLILAALGLITATSAQSNEASEDISYTLSAMRILDLEGTAPTLTLSAPTEGGAVVDDVTSNTSWINYTSIVDEGQTNVVTVALSGSSVPNGTTLKVVAGNYQGTGDGDFGTPAAEVILSSTAQNLITGIGSCYTGDGNTNGHQLTYTWSVNVDSYESLIAGAASDITAVYTITTGP